MLTLTVSNLAEIHPVAELPKNALTLLKDRLTLDNPEFIDRERRGFSTWNIQSQLTFYQAGGSSFSLPRGFTRHAMGILREAGVPFTIDDRRRALPEIDFTFSGKLRDYQEEAVKAVLSRDFGVLQAPTGSGKTVMALSVIAARKQPCLIVVHTQELLHQWIGRIEAFLGIPAGEAGKIGGGKMVLGAQITVGLVQSLYKCAEDVAPHVGHLIVDECHRAPSRIFTEAVKAFDSRYMLGLSATPWRRDGLTRLIYLHLGDKVHEIDGQALIENGSVLRAEIVYRETAFKTTVDPSEQYSRMLSELTEDPARNRLIASDVATEAKNGSGVCLVLTDRKAHCEAIQGLLVAMGINTEVLTGDCRQDERRRIIQALNAGLVRVVVATGQLVGEGFDHSGLSTLFLATPVKFDGRLLQYLGRVLRPAPGKKQARVYDYLDPVGVLENAARKRRKVYEAA